MITNSNKVNVSLLAEWWWNLEQEQVLWQEIVKAKYLHNSSIFSVTHKVTDSPIWYDLLKEKDTYLQGRGISIRNGKKTRFWCDSWLYDKPIYYIAPILFILCEYSDANVADFKNDRIQIN